MILAFLGNFRYRFWPFWIVVFEEFKLSLTHTAALESLLAPVMPSDPDSVKLAAKRAAITRLFRDGVGVLILVGLGIVFGPHAWLWVRHVRW